MADPAETAIHSAEYGTEATTPAITKRQWVVGFMYGALGEHVVLIRKNRPEWQAGKLNGVGGKVEAGETIHQAMAREFYEETGNTAQPGFDGWQWDHFASLTWEEGVVHFFRCFANDGHMRLCRTVTDEAIEVWRVADVLDSTEVTPNLRWLVPLGAHRHDTYDVIDVVETGTTLRKPGRLDVLGSHKDGTRA